MMKRLSLLVVVLFLISPVFAKDYFFKEISTHATILPNSDIFVQENYTYSFNENFFFVYRSFFMDRIESINNFRVWNAETGQVYSPRIIYSGEKIYNWTISASYEDQTYTMEYTIVGAINEYNETVDYLWYSIVPVEREKRIDSVSFWITFPKDIRGDITPRSSRTAEWSWVSDDAILFTTSNIEPYGTFDIDFYMSEGTVEFYVTPSESASFFFSILLLLAVLALFGYFIFVARRDYNLYGKDPVVEDMKIVRRLRPALAGIVLDERVDIKEIEATILDLAIRGYIYIREEEKKSFFGKKEIWFLKTKSVKGLMEYEAKIVRAIFGTKEKVKVSSLKNKFYKHTSKILKEMHKEAAKHKLFDENVEKTIVKYGKKFFMFPIVLTVVSVLLVGMFFGMGFRARGMFPTTMVLSFMSIPLMFMIAFVSSMAMPRKTRKGVAQSNRYKDLKDWMKRYPLKKGRLFDEYLPYATAFGIQRVWVKKLKDLEGYESDWFSGPYTTASFIALHSSMTESFAAPGSSGGAGGGGFGGGGGAGGGGAGAG
jgi:uncharacterized membrane protein